MAFANIPDSKIGAYIAVAIGRGKAELKIKVNRELDELKDKVRQNCGNIQELENISKTLSQITSKVDSYKANVEVIKNKIISPLEKITTTLNIALVVIELLPTPNTTTTTGVVVKASGVRQKIKEFIRQISDDVKNINLIIGAGGVVVSTQTSGLLQVIDTVSTKIKELDSLIGQCKKQGTFEEEQAIPSNVDSSNETSNINFFTSSTGETYTIKVNIVDSSKIAPLRQAVAIDKVGIVRFSSDTSFTSSTDVLIKEVQFKINNNIL
jgi:hypothetical protein